MYEGDIVLYNMDAYGFDVDVEVKIVGICEHTILVEPTNNWPVPFNNWQQQQRLSPAFIVRYVYTIEPSTPPR